MRLTIALILLLSFFAILGGCSLVQDTTDVWPERSVINAQAFHLRFNEPSNIQAALDTAKFLIIDNAGQVVRVKGVTHTANIFDTTAGQWTKQMFGTSIALYPIRQLYTGIYILELYDVDETTGEISYVCPTFVYVFYDRNRIEYWDIKVE